MTKSGSINASRSVFYRPAALGHSGARLKGRFKNSGVGLRNLYTSLPGDSYGCFTLRTTSLDSREMQL